MPMKSPTARDPAALSRRSLLRTSAASAASLVAIPVIAQTAQPAPSGSVSAGSEHWAIKEAGTDRVRLYLWRKPAVASKGSAVKGTLIFVHGSSMASTPSFDLQVPGQPEYSIMDWFAARGYDTWCVDMEGYGKSDKKRAINSDISTGADDIAAAAQYIRGLTGASKFLLYGISSGSLRVALFAQRHPELTQRIVLDAFVWTGAGSRTLEQRRKRLAEYEASNRRKISRETVHGIFTRDHADTADMAVVDVFADAVLALDDSVPTGTYVDMSKNLPLVDPLRITAPTLILRGQYDGIAAFEDITSFFIKLPNPDKQLVVMAGIAHSSLHEKNHLMVNHAMQAFFTQPTPVYRG